MDRLNSMKYFVAVVECGNFSAASRKLEIPKTTLNRGINSLEAYLGAKLFVRSTRKLCLTEIGKVYLNSCHAILDQVAQSEKMVSNKQQNPVGELTVTAPVLFGNIHVVPVINEFLKKYTDIKIRLLLEDRTVNIHEESVDLAIRVGELPDSNLVAKSVGSVSKITCASGEYLSKQGRPNNPQDLDRHSCISTDNLDGSKTWRFYSGKNEIDVSIRPRLYTNSTESAIKAACDGLGITRVLSYQAKHWIDLNKLELILEPYKGAALPVSLLFNKQNNLPFRLRLLIDYLHPKLKYSIEEANIAY